VIDLRKKNKKKDSGLGQKLETMQLVAEENFMKFLE